MENKAHYALIGAFVLLALAAALAFIMWLSGAQLNRQFDEYQVSFNGAVRGLSQGSEVRFNGLKVGEVTTLKLDPQNPNKVLAGIQVTADTPVDTKSYARLEPLGLTGLNYIQIFSGGEEFPLIKDLPGKGPKRIEGQMSQIDSFLDEGGSVIEGAQKALARMNAVMSADAIEDFHGILDNLNQISENLRDADVDPDLIERMLKAFEQAAIDVSGAAETVDIAAKDFDALVQGDVKSALARAEVSMGELDKALGSIGNAADGTGDLIVDARDAINRLSNSGLTDLEETVDTIRRLVNTLGRIADNLEQNPSQFIAGTEREVVELPQ